ncbi:cardiolipin synthase [Treponema sp. OMZ 799]|uniref:cardiolipin synthase n=1 Tax=Treponema sp. OMZ 799 TaxID=2563668 RepID=UPI0020A5316D|nr:cardiolipin synthase [Treponema sp. OMZ 799]UTC78845.1 cardiolipin synthase [Treponema sp. OMZ 799]
MLAVFHTLGFFSSLNAIITSRTSQGAIAWTVGLNSFPVITVPAYWVFGRNRFDGYAEEWKANSDITENRIKEISKNLEPYFVEPPDVFPEYEVLKKLALSPFLNGNKIDLLLNGAETYKSIEEGIEKAEEYVLFQFYILKDDEIGTKFKDQLLRKAKEGVAVYVLYDELGSRGISKEWLNSFSVNGIKVLPFNTQQDHRFQINFRNHRKIVVVDGKAAWVGGLNIGDDHLDKDPVFTPWRDTHLMIEGPSVIAAQATFLVDWHWASKELISGLNWEPNIFKGDNSDKNVLVLASGPADKYETASLFFTNLLNAARKRIWIATPYFIPDEATMTALRLALLKGIEVRILTPRMYDNWFVFNAANAYLDELADDGAKIYFYENGFMHQKVMLIDDSLSAVGTVNFDNRSFRLNFEITALIADKPFASEIEQMLLNDFAVSSDATADYGNKQSFWIRLKSKFSTMFAPVL